jgi:hypothetical protein
LALPDAADPGVEAAGEFAELSDGDEQAVTSRDKVAAADTAIELVRI